MLNFRSPFYPLFEEGGFLMKRKKLTMLLVIGMLVAASMLFAGGRQEVDSTDHGPLVPDLVILSSLPEANLVNYEMSQELAEELGKLGVNITAQPTDFAVLLDVIYGEEMDYDAYTIGWSGRVERLDPDMFIYSINHSANANPGGNNTERYINPDFDALADAQRSEMDVDTRREIVWEAQRILAEDVSRVTTYSRANVQTYNKERFTNLENMSGEGLFNEWSPMVMEPLTDRRVPVVASNVNITNLNPFMARSVYDWRNLRLIYDKLVRLSVDVTPTPWAATGWEIVDDTTIDVTLRGGMNFHDGTPVTTADVKYSYEAFMAQQDSYFAAFVEPIDSIELIGDSVIRFNLKNAYAPFITTTLTQIPILPMHIWSNVGDVTQYNNEHPVGSGPFEFVRFRNGEELVANKFNDYFYPVKIDGYIFKIYASPEGILSDLQLQVVDMVSYDLIPAHINQIKDNEGGRYSHLEITEAPDIGFFYIGMNNFRPPFNNKDFRIAVAHLVDYDYALDVLLDGYGSRGGGGLVINAANEFWHNPEVPIYDTYDPEKARQILVDAGFTWDSQGRMRMPK